ncbi:MAG: hypothetical protein ACSW8E_00090 [Clostridia bacterium]
MPKGQLSDISDFSIADDKDKSKGKNSDQVIKKKEQHSERDNSVSDRELLREAAEHEGASEELKKYAKKADNLEAYQRRLERQEAKLREMEKESPSLADASQPPLGKGALQERRICSINPLFLERRLSQCFLFA